MEIRKKANAQRLGQGGAMPQRHGSPIKFKFPL